MNFLKKNQQQTFAIYGMGASGISTAKALKLLKIKNIICWDDDSKTRNKFKKKFSFKKFWIKRSKKKIKFIIISPGIDIKKCKIRNFLKKNKSKIITDIDLFFEINKNKNIISITGTNGKSTTCKILEKIFQKAGYPTQVGGNIGKPILSLKTLPKNGVYIIEVSSYQLDYSKIFRSKHAAILNISSDHLDRHKNLSNYVKVKSKIFHGQKKGDFTYISKEDKHANNAAKIFRSKKIKSNLLKIKTNNSELFKNKIKNKYIQNLPNLTNFTFAYKIAKNYKIKSKTIFKSINNFKGLPHRQELIFVNKSFAIINDSKATSFSATEKTLKNYNKIYWILGGLPKHKDVFNLQFVSKKIVKAYVVGNYVPYFVKKIRNYINYATTKNISSAFNKILNEIKKRNEKNCTILFSPAAASFDQFKNFEDRGNYFKSLIKKKNYFNV